MYYIVNVQYGEAPDGNVQSTSKRFANEADAVLWGRQNCGDYDWRMDVYKSVVYRDGSRDDVSLEVVYGDAEGEYERESACITIHGELYSI